MARDVGNSVIATGSLATQRWTGVYEYELHSNTFGGYDQAVKQDPEAGGKFLLNAMADGASLGVKPLIEGVVDYAQTGDATNASRMAGGVAAGNLSGAAMMKFGPRIPLPRLRNPLSRLGGNCPPPQILGRGRAPLWTSTANESSVQNAFRHFVDHGADFGAANALDYAARASRFLNDPPPGTQTAIRPNGDVMRYNPITETFGVMDANGAPRTFFKPVEGASYWNRQVNQPGVKFYP